MSLDIPTTAGALAQIACFTMFAHASYKYFQQGESLGHAITRAASLGGTLVFAGLAVTRTGASAAFLLTALVMTGASAWIFREAITSAGSGVLHVAFADGPSGRLVTEGIYGRIRNPFYTSYLLYWLAWAVLLQLHWTGLLGLAFFSMLYWKAALREEASLSRQFGAAYADYRARAGRFAPRLGR